MGLVFDLILVMLNKKITRISLAISFTFILLMWAVFLLDYYQGLDLYRFGVYPQKLEGLKGILFSPFIHSTKDFSHILNNTTPMFILSWMLFYHYRKIATKSLVLIYLLSGIGVWVLARDNFHIGMSGVIYGLASFLVISGFFRKSMRISAISLIVIFLYGSMIWGIFPLQVQMSWEGHLMGLLSGALTAILFKQKGPQPAKFRYEIEEELGIEPGDYWKIPDPLKPQNQEETPKQQDIIIRYHFIPKQINLPQDQLSQSEEE